MILYSIVGFFIPTIENREEPGIRVCFSFYFTFFVFKAKSGTTKKIGVSWFIYHERNLLEVYLLSNSYRIR